VPACTIRFTDIAQQLHWSPLVLEKTDSRAAPYEGGLLTRGLTKLAGNAGCTTGGSQRDSTMSFRDANCCRKLPSSPWTSCFKRTPAGPDRPRLTRTVVMPGPGGAGSLSALRVLVFAVAGRNTFSALGALTLGDDTTNFSTLRARLTGTASLSALRALLIRS